MKDAAGLFVQIFIIGAMLSLTGCLVVPVQSDAGYRAYDEGYESLSYAPANGHRYNHQGHEVVYDSNLGVYQVSGYPDYYLYDDNYYRRERDHWSYSRDLDRGWRDYTDNRLPPALSSRYSSRKNNRNSNQSNRDDHDDDRGNRSGSRGYYDKDDRGRHGQYDRDR
jgi:hypothetical protein